MPQRKVLLLEINEITWDLIDPFIAEGKLPTFARLKREGALATPMSVDMPPHLDPWITWTTIYTGQRQAAHNVFFLQQPPDTIKAKRLWEICAERGLSVGVYGSVCSWPPQHVNGYYIPDTFSQDAQTYPASLEPIQMLNLTYTRSIRLPSDQDGLSFKLKLGSKLPGLGLSISTMAAIGGQLIREKLNPEVRWQRVALQPRVNFDFFQRLYRTYRPQFATFHTNHVAHYMHTYWKAMKPDVFKPLETSPDEVRVYGSAIEYGYRTADALLAKVLSLLDGDTVLVVASSMGQQPFFTKLKKGKSIMQPRSLDRILEILGVAGEVRAVATMSGQFNIYHDTQESREKVVSRLKQAYIDKREQLMFFVDESVPNSVSVDVLRYDEVNENSLCYFPHAEAGVSYRYDDLIYTSDVVKSGCHDPKGMMIMYGAGVRSGSQAGECNNLDIAPTLLTLLGVPVPDEMEGRVLKEMFTDIPAADRARVLTA